MKKNILVIVLLLCLTACATDRNIVECNEGYINVNNECALPKDESEIDYTKMGFQYDFNEPYQIEYIDLFLEDFWRTDGTLYPYANNQINLINWSDTELVSVRSNIEGYLQYFDTNVYNIYSRNEIDQQQRYYTDVVKIEDEYQVIFYRDNQNTIFWNIRPGDYIDIIESNGVYSYVMNKKYLGYDELDNRNHNFRVFYAIYHSTDFPYIIYFSNDYIFFLNRSLSFPKDCIALFDNDTDIILFKD